MRFLIFVKIYYVSAYFCCDFLPAFVISFVICCCCTVVPEVSVNKDVVYQAVGYRIELQCFGEGNPVPQKEESYWSSGDDVTLLSSSDEYVFVKYFS